MNQKKRSKKTQDIETSSSNKRSARLSRSSSDSGSSKTKSLSPDQDQGIDCIDETAEWSDNALEDNDRSSDEDFCSGQRRRPLRFKAKPSSLETSNGSSDKTSSSIELLPTTAVSAAGGVDVGVAVAVAVAVGEGNEALSADLSIHCDQLQLQVWLELLYPFILTTRSIFCLFGHILSSTISP
jgi:hypothetical protein